MLATKTTNRLQNRNRMLQFETGPSMSEITRRVMKIRQSWTAEERAVRACEGQRRLDALAASLGLQ